MLHTHLFIRRAPAKLEKCETEFMYITIISQSTNKLILTQRTCLLTGLVFVDCNLDVVWESYFQTKAIQPHHENLTVFVTV